MVKSKAAFHSFRATARPPRSAMHVVTRTFVTLALLVLGACGAVDRLTQVGRPPPLTEIENPSRIAGERPVRVPLPAPVESVGSANSLWRPGSSSFLQDQRAETVASATSWNNAPVS